MANTYHYTEDSYEQTVLDVFRELGYEVLYGPDVDAATGRDITYASMPEKLREAMLRINSNEKTAAVDEALRKVHELFSQPLLQANVQLTDWLQNGIDVTLKSGDGTLRSDHIRLLASSDFVEGRECSYWLDWSTSAFMKSRLATIQSRL